MSKSISKREVVAGSFRCRSSFFGKLILQVQVRYYWSPSNYNLDDEETFTQWEDAKVSDFGSLSTLNLQYFLK